MKRGNIMSKSRVAIYDCNFSCSDEAKNKYNNYIADMEKGIVSCPEYKFVGTFLDVCSESTPIDERTEFRKVVEKVKDNEVDILVCLSKSVFGRNLVKSLAVFHYLEDSGVSVKFGSEIFEHSGERVKSESLKI